MSVQVGNWSMPVTWWIRQFRLKASAVRARIRADWSGPEVIFGCNRKRRPPDSHVLRIGGHELPVARWARLTGQRAIDIERRLTDGMEPVEAVFYRQP